MECTQEKRVNRLMVNRAHRTDHIPIDKDDESDACDDGVQDPRFAYQHKPIYINCQVINSADFAIRLF
jgi:hypothetical protein